MEEIKRRMAEIIGEASMCWSETPTGVFNSNKASELLDEIMTHIKYPIFEKSPTTKESILRQNDVCRCLHTRKCHGKSYSINYSEGRCEFCNCKHFIIN